MFDTRSEGPSGRFHGNKTVSLWLCPRCAARRRNIGWFWLVSVLLTLAAMTIFFRWIPS